jgi:hypothetical protein
MNLRKGRADAVTGITIEGGNFEALSGLYVRLGLTFLERRVTN